LAKIAERSSRTPLEMLLANADRFEELAEQAKEEGKLDDEIVFRSYMRDNADRAAPYCHPKLSTVTHQGDDSKSIVHEMRRLIVRSPHA
jgi:hypothetical protein